MSGNLNLIVSDFLALDAWRQTLTSHCTIGTVRVKAEQSWIEIRTCFVLNSRVTCFSSCDVVGSQEARWSRLDIRNAIDVLLRYPNRPLGHLAKG